MRKSKKSLAKDSKAASVIDNNGGSSSSVSRRKFLSKAGGATAAIAAASAGLPSLLGAQSSPAGNQRSVSLIEREVKKLTGVTSQQSTTGNAVSGEARALQAFRVRVEAAITDLRKPLPTQVSNGDEALYANDNYIGNYSKGLPHDSNGLVSASDYQLFLTACTTGNPSDWAAVPLGGVVPLVSPQAGLAFNLEGADNAAVSIPPAPVLASAGIADALVENYWMALLRDVPFSDYTNPASPNAALVSTAIADLNKLSAFTGPTPVTGQNLFRGNTAGDLVGPYVSQFLLMALSGAGTTVGAPGGNGLGTLDVFDGSGVLGQQYTLYAPGVDYMTDTASWLAVENGQATNPSAARGVFYSFGDNQYLSPGFLYNGRALTSLVHVDELYQHYFWAATEMLASGFAANPGNPYSATLTPNQAAFATWGGPHFTGLIGEAAYRGIQAVWYHKFYVHRAPRPEEFAGRVQNTIVGGLNFPISGEVLNSAAAAQVFSNYGTYYLPQAYPEGCPWHPSYAEGHGTVAASCVTLMKALWDESTSFTSKGINPVYSPDGVSLVNYEGSPIDQGDTDQITVGTELNKLAANIALGGRVIAGVHWRYDYYSSLLLGEQVAIGLLQDIVNTFNEPNGSFQFTGFLGNQVTITKQ